MRLIDAEHFINRFVSLCETDTDIVIAKKVCDTLIDEPTAYDIGKVAEELKTDFSIKLYGSGNSDNYLIPVKRAIEIVKQGGVNR